MTPNRANTMTVPVTNFDLMRALDGHEIVIGVVSGTPVSIRLYGTQELLDAHRHECEIADMDPTMTRSDAAALAAPVSIDALIARRR